MNIQKAWPRLKRKSAAIDYIPAMFLVLEIFFNVENS